MDQAKPPPPQSSSTPRTSVSSTSSSSIPAPTTTTPPLSLLEPVSSTKKKNRTRVFRVFRNVFRSFPIITPACRLPSLPGGRLPDSNSRIIAGSRITGTLFGYRKGRVSLSIQENPRNLPTVVVELALQTNVLQKEMNLGMILKPVSMGAGVLPGKSDVEGPDGEMTYMRAHFERVVKSKDAETLYMLSPDANDGPELSIFFEEYEKEKIVEKGSPSQDINNKGDDPQEKPKVEHEGGDEKDTPSQDIVNIEGEGAQEITKVEREKIVIRVDLAVHPTPPSKRDPPKMQTDNNKL
ncbi:hypothetical protein RDI58_013823 [Solanum bulbocastanum]|uniref:Uncharacterized protein n=1 Tax=Solanum bulbocastanum TaxID=147425 RepID=A0AAN8TK90_SOLBU